jgi:hypothetical protein
MAIERVAPQASVTEVLDRVLDRGIVIDAWLRVSVIGITLIDVDARVVVASISTYLQHADAVAQTGLASRPAPAVSTTPAPRPARRTRARLVCEDGCTFIRAAPRCPRKVRCPSHRGRLCPVTVFAAVA